MMTCLEFRRRVGAEPFASDPDIEAHRRECAACARHQDDLRAMDGVIRRALAVNPPPRAAQAVRGARRRHAPAAVRDRGEPRRRAPPSASCCSSAPRAPRSRAR